MPYNAFLSKTFDAHINVEMCHTVTAIKYLCKYFMKGHDRARVGLVTDGEGQLALDEVKAFLDTRCVTPPEATWRLMENPLHEQSHAVRELAVHLPNGQRIFFAEGQEEEAIRRAATRKTTLTAWFELNQQDEEARQYLYQDIPSHYVWQIKGKWTRWVRQATGDMCIGRVASVSPRNVEAYHLRLLLLNVPGATSFDYLRTIDGVVYDTFKQAALARGLIVDDREWFRCMEEAALYMMPYQLRSLFAMLVIHCEVASPAELWEQFRAAMTEDFQHRGHDEALATSMALLQIQADLEAAGFTCADKGLPEPQPLVENVEAAVGDDERRADAARGEELVAMLYEQQRAAADAILTAVIANDASIPNCFYIDGPGGTGNLASFL